jgi:hypothetical protein
VHNIWRSSPHLGKGTGGVAPSVHARPRWTVSRVTNKEMIADYSLSQVEPMTDKPLTAVLTGVKRGDWLAMSGYSGGPVRLGKVSDVTPKLAHVGYSKFYITSGEAFQGHCSTASARLSTPEEHGQVRQDAESRMTSSDFGETGEAACLVEWFELLGTREWTRLTLEELRTVRGMVLAGRGLAVG